MAGLQYNFFPTDFFYPRTKPKASDSAGKEVVHLQTTTNRDVVDNLEQPTGLVLNNLHENQVLKAITCRGKGKVRASVVIKTPWQTTEEASQTTN